jgi:hypothetical protein
MINNLKIFYVVSIFCLVFIQLISGQSIPLDIIKIDIQNNIKNVKLLKLSFIGNEISYIPLETTTKSLIQKINKIVISEKYIFIIDTDKVLQFDKSGKFIRVVGSQGRGPEEYLRIYDLCVNEQKNEVYILSSPSKLLIFRLDGGFKISRRVNKQPSQIIQIDHGSLMYYIPHIPGKDDPGWIITNSEGKMIQSFNNFLKRINQPGFLTIKTPLYNYLNLVHFMEFGNDTIYIYNHYKRIPYGIFLLGDLKMDPDIRISQSMINNKSEILFKKLWTSSLIENDRFMFINLNLGISDEYLCSIYEKKNKTLTILKNNEFLNDIDGGPAFWPEQITKDNYMIGYVDAYDILKPKPNELVKIGKPGFTNLRKKLTETSNPVIIVVK